MREQVERLYRWGPRPERTSTRGPPLEEGTEAYKLKLASGGQSGKVRIVLED